MVTCALLVESWLLLLLLLHELLMMLVCGANSVKYGKSKPLIT